MGLDVPLATCYGNCHEFTKERLKIYQFECQRKLRNNFHVNKAFPYVIICLFLKIETWKNSIVQFHRNIITRLNWMMGNELKSQQKHFTILLFNYDKDSF